MMRHLGMAVALILTAPCALAEELDRIETPSGEAALVRQDFDSILQIGGQEFRLNGMIYASFADRLGDVVLVQMSAGGTACPASYAWLDTRPGLVRMTAQFGTCSDLHEVSWDSESVIVSMPSMVPGEGQVDFIWDGKSAEVQEILQDPVASGLVPGGEIAGWAGRFGAELLEDPEWQASLNATLGPEALADAQRIVQVGHPFERQGDWLVATGCQPHQCDVTMGAIALNAQDGRMVLALWEAGLGPRAWGDLSAGIPQALVAVIVGP